MPRPRKAIDGFSSSSFQERSNDQAVNGQVTTWIDPSAFTWYKTGQRNAGEMAIVIHKDYISILSAAGEKFISWMEEDYPFIHVKIGIAPKAIAIKPVARAESGIRARKAYKKKNPASDSLRLACSSIMAKMTFPEGQLPVRVPVIWDEKNEMLVGKLS